MYTVDPQPNAGADYPKVSVLLPVFNGESYLRGCISSVLAQSLENFELLIGDDRSTDHSREIVAEFADPRIRPFYRTTNLRLFGNLNNLIASAQAPLIRFLCQDDLLESDCLAREAAFFAERASIGMSFCKCVTIDKTGQSTGQWAIDDLPPLLHPAMSLQLLYYYGCIPGNLSTVCVRRSALEQCGVFDETFTVSGDYELWTRICRQMDLGVVQQRLIRLRAHEGQLSRAAASGLEFIRQNRRIRATLAASLPAQTRRSGRVYAMLRQNVLDLHYGIRCLASGRGNMAWKVVSALGVSESLIALLAWVCSCNNRLWKPRPRFYSAGS